MNSLHVGRALYLQTDVWRRPIFNGQTETAQATSHPLRIVAAAWAQTWVAHDQFQRFGGCAGRGRWRRACAVEIMRGAAHPIHERTCPGNYPAKTAHRLGHRSTNAERNPIL